MDVLNGVFQAFGLTAFLLGVQSLLWFPLTIVYELRKRRFLARAPRGPREPVEPAVSVIVPAYNEERTIAACVASIALSPYPRLEIIVVDDGSTDGTPAALAAFDGCPRVTRLRQRNAGKAAALNAGIARASGEIIVATDADSIFLPRTIPAIVRWFSDPRIDAVCGDDTPLRPVSPLQKLLTITTHIGTGFVRRAFSVLGVLPIISGNCAAVRSSALAAAGGFSDGWGEDLDLTFKLHRIGARIVYDPDALVLCETPRTFGALWRQRVRWIRSYLSISARHGDMFFRPAFAPFSFYLPLNWANIVVVPLLQAALALWLPFAFSSGAVEAPGLLGALSMLGFLFFAAVAVYSILLDRRPGHLKYLPLYGWLVVPFSFFLDAVVAAACSAELRRSTEVWHKAERRDPAAAGERRAWLYPAGVSLTAAAVAGTFLFLRFDVPPPPLPDARGVSLTLATHFDAWDDPRKAVGSILARGRSAFIGSIGVGAGRYEWNYFRWKGHEGTWSNHQKGVSYDLLEDAVERSAAARKGVIAIVDVYAPGYIAQHPEAAAAGSDGARSGEQVCFEELVAGEYGRRLQEMVGYLARTYALAGISLTELDYRRYCYDDRCLAAFAASGGGSSWPRTIFGGDVNKDARSLGEWRSAAMAAYLRTLADSTHKYGKKFFVDVPVDYDDLASEGRGHGLAYGRLLGFADGIVVWDYFYLEGRDPSATLDVARYLTTRYDPSKIILSVGLWGRKAVVSPDELALAVDEAVRGGARRIWVTPNHLLTAGHWERLTRELGAR